MSRKKPKNHQTQFIKHPIGVNSISEAEVERLATIDYPLFSFKYLSEASFKDQGDLKFFRDFIRRLRTLSNINWNIISSTNRHGFGTEKIDRNSIHPEIPKEVTSDVNLIAFRSSGDNRAMVGFRMWNIFYIVFIEARHNDIYNHG